MNFLRLAFLTLFLLLATPVFALTQEEHNAFDNMVGSLADLDIDFTTDYRKGPTGSLQLPGQVIINVSKRFKRKDLYELFAKHPQGGFVRNALDVGRHRIVKNLIADSIREVNAAAKANSSTNGQLPQLNNVLTVNSGSTGKAERDLDVTIYAGVTPTDVDIMREEALFRKLAEKADKAGFSIDVTDGGLTIKELEVTMFRGLNNPPDARFAVDAEAHRRDYTRAITKQSADAETYKGAGWKVEVLARTRRGAAHVQQFDTNGGKLAYRTETPDGSKVNYSTQIPADLTELRSIFQGTADLRFQKWELSSHMVNNALQSMTHTLKGEADATKGALKYASRSLDSLAQYYDMPPWTKLNAEAKEVLVAKVYPGFSEAQVKKLVKTLNVAAFVGKHKQLPSIAEGKADLQFFDRAAEIFMRRAAAFTAGEMARTMLSPPAFNSSKIRMSDAQKASFEKLSMQEKIAYMTDRDDSYARAVSYESMENLLMTMVELKKLDYRKVRDPKTGEVTFEPLKVQRGRETIEMIRLQADNERTQKLLNLAGAYAGAYSKQMQATSPLAANKHQQTMNRLRGQMEAMIGRGSPGDELVREMARKTPSDFLRKAETDGKSPFRATLHETNQRFRQHVADAFPSVKDEWASFRRSYEAQGAKSYVRRRLAEEAMDMDNIADGLQLIEMYQTGASAGEYAWFFTTNVLSRFHWSASHFIQAYQTRSTEDLKTLGKNLAFATMARVLPAAGQAKVFFDIAQGTANVTMGYAVNTKNAQTIADVYTGDALGPVNRKRVTAGTVASARRDSGFTVLQPSDLKTFRPPEAKVDEVAVDRAKLYQRLFQRWTGRDAFDVPNARSGKPTSDDSFTAAHDALAHLMNRQAQSRGPTWVTVSRTFYDPASKQEFDAATDRFNALLKEKCTSEVRRVLDEGAVRTYQSWADEKDAIETGLVQRLTQDVFLGFMEAWENQLTAQVMAKREIEKTAMNADMAAIARSLQKEIYPKNRKQKTTARSADLKLNVDVNGVPSLHRVDAETVYDGAYEVTFYPRLDWEKAPSAFDNAVRIEVVQDRMTPVKVKTVAEGKGQVMRNDLVFAALNKNGEELARASLTLHVLVTPLSASLQLLGEDPIAGQDMKLLVAIDSGEPPFALKGVVQDTITDADRPKTLPKSAKHWEKTFTVEAPASGGLHELTLNAEDKEGEIVTAKLTVNVLALEKGKEDAGPGTAQLDSLSLTSTPQIAPQAPSIKARAKFGRTPEVPATHTPTKQALLALATSSPPANAKIVNVKGKYGSKIGKRQLVSFKTDDGAEVKIVTNDPEPNIAGREAGLKNVYVSYPDGGKSILRFDASGKQLFEKTYKSAAYQAVSFGKIVTKTGPVLDRWIEYSPVENTVIWYWERETAILKSFFADGRLRSATKKRLLGAEPLKMNDEWLKGWYANGKPEFEQFVDENRMIDGLAARWYDNGQIASEQLWKDGKKVGVWRVWYDTGILKSQIYHVSDGHQIRKTYYANGSAEIEHDKNDIAKKYLGYKWTESGCLIGDKNPIPECQ